MQNVKIKVCGITSTEQVQQLADLGVDYAGFIFYDKSLRYVGNKIEATELKAISGIEKVGVFVNESIEKIKQTIKQYGLNAVQLHGDETPSLCKALANEATVIKAFRIKGDEDLLTIIKPYTDMVDYFLFDTKAQEYGGTGKKFDWSVLANTEIPKPYFLSGGIGLEDADKTRQFTQTNPVFALDVNSKFETEPGVKDLEKVKYFLQHQRCL